MQITRGWWLPAANSSGEKNQISGRSTVPFMLLETVYWKLWMHFLPLPLVLTGYPWCSGSDWLSWVWGCMNRITIGRISTPLEIWINTDKCFKFFLQAQSGAELNPLWGCPFSTPSVILRWLSNNATYTRINTAPLRPRKPFMIPMMVPP